MAAASGSGSAGGELSTEHQIAALLAAPSDASLHAYYEKVSNAAATFELLFAVGQCRRYSRS